MKLTKELKKDDLKNISKISIKEWNAFQKGKEVTFNTTLTPLKTKVRYECISVWKKGNKVRDYEVKIEKRYESFSLALRRINAAVIFQRKPTPTNTYTITYERI